MSDIVDILVPAIGDFTDVPIIDVLVKVGDEVKVEDSLITVESDKATMDVPSPVAGVISELRVKVGDKISEGVLVARVKVSNPIKIGAGDTAALVEKSVETSAETPVKTPAETAPAVAAPAPIPAPTPTAIAAPAPSAESSATPGTHAHASPSVRAFARTLGVDVAKVSGTGLKGRITQADVEAFVKGVMTGAGSAAVASGQTSGGLNGLNLLPWPTVDFAKFGAIELRPLSRIKKISGANLARNWAMIPHVTQFDEADITDLEAFRVATNKELEKSGVKLTMLAFLIKAVVSALKKFPDFNASLEGRGDEQRLVLKQYFHIGFAADTPNGLMVPVLRDADKKGLADIAREMGALAQKARDGKLGSADMQGGCFSISSLGGIGGTAFTPIINAPEVAILGVSKTQTKPVWDGAAFVPRQMLPLSLSYDHRVIDGAAAARFTSYLSALLVDMRKVLL
ncbi:dihydrolipoamide acetyltransferase [Rugosibacter aromaticivorans]|uniref:Acetyltransferase component of pyruvate dehydrogenase complex n=1 Tax=Rugosibacter aromaticivorans TaxID=1565605 RepID=A0A0C5JB15_9PROT|nr:dihydrolipoyllysine-residue acetyltransferase [Rugosibacter aromaticivorans]AJP48998.1 dihydrolipoamide acetyltransferase [Rugosibacter aromaticivorans]TBR12933.1 MAG: dihydrolipoyllysine-residue acetyltransferase [Rugosibacter sp.]